MNEDMEKMLQEAPAPTLTLEPFAEEKEEPAVVEKEEAVQPLSLIHISEPTRPY